MRLNVFSQTYREVRRPMLIWSLVLALVTWALLLVYPLVRNAWVPAVVLPDWAGVMLGTHLGEVNVLQNARSWWLAAAFNFTLPVLMTIYAARQGSLLMARDEERGSLGFLLSAPLPRGQLVVEKFITLLLMLLVPAAAVWLAGTITGFFNPRPSLGLFLLGLAFGAPAFALASITGRHLLSQNFVLAAALLTFLVDRLAEQSPGQAVMRLFSPFSYYSAVLAAGGLLVPVLVLLGLSLLAFALAWIIFDRRDLQI